MPIVNGKLVDENQHIVPKQAWDCGKGCKNDKLPFKAFNDTLFDLSEGLNSSQQQQALRPPYKAEDAHQHVVGGESVENIEVYRRRAESAKQQSDDKTTRKLNNAA